MRQSAVQSLVAATLFRMDRAKAAKAAATIATTLARGEGHTALRRAAAVAAQVLQAQAGPPPAPQGAPSYAGGVADSSGVEGPNEELVRPNQEAVLRGPMDALNCGDFAFTIFNSTQLIANKLNTDGAIGGLFEISSIPPHRWTALMGRGDDPVLPVRIRRDGAAVVTVSVGSVPTGTPVVWCVD